MAGSVYFPPHISTAHYTTNNTSFTSDVSAACLFHPAHTPTHPLSPPWLALWTSQNTCGVPRLPAYVANGQVLTHSLSYLDVKSLLAAGATCRALHAVTNVSRVQILC